MPADQFDKDFGYLMPFLDKVAAAAPALSDSGARAELTRLVADEKQRWARIRQLLSGASSAPSANENPKATNSGVGAGAAVGTASASPTTKPTFTVGSLRPRRD